jgi:hypothetical protein
MPQNVAQHMFWQNYVIHIFTVEKSGAKCGLLLYLKKTRQSKQSTYVRKFNKSGHPVLHQWQVKKCIFCEKEKKSDRTFRNNNSKLCLCRGTYVGANYFCPNAYHST